MGDKYENRIMLPLSLSYDHRVIDGAEGARFCVHLKESLGKDFAYKCYCSEEEIKEQKEKAKKKEMPFVYNRKWRDPKDLEIPKNIEPVIRFKSKISGNTLIKDLVQAKLIYQIL